MIVGIGVDIIRVERLRRALRKTAGFETRVFAPEEIDYCNAKAFPERHYAARFAAKEAVMKALGTGWSGGIRFQDIVVTMNNQGQPFIEILSPTAERIPGLHELSITISLSHERDHAIAFAVVYRSKT
ncbi:holo-ACP synthase [bacterium]|nr:holo-ACP synthase [candidate division CSSED10-310 bacterium]